MDQALRCEVQEIIESIYKNLALLVTRGSNYLTLQGAAEFYQVCNLCFQA